MLVAVLKVVNSWDNVFNSVARSGSKEKAEVVFSVFPCASLGLIHTGRARAAQANGTR